MSIMPLVSILLPTHNGARFIRRSIESIRSQTFKDWELIVVNDGSTDATGALVSEIAAIDKRIRLIRFETNKGIQKALNEGLIQAKGELIARLDDDDVWADPEKLKKQIEYLAAHPDCVLVGTGVIVQNEAGDELYRFLNPVSDEKIRRRLLYRNCFSHSSVLFRRSAAMKFSGYDESEATLHTEDYDLWLKLGTVGKLANLAEYLVRFTSRAGAISNNNKLAQLRRQLAITGKYGSSTTYRGYPASRIKSYLRYALYWTFGKFVPARTQEMFIRFYKRA